jgi:hypothetical protein
MIIVSLGNNRQYYVIKININERNFCLKKKKTPIFREKVLLFFYFTPELRFIMIQCMFVEVFCGGDFFFYSRSHVRVVW